MDFSILKQRLAAFIEQHNVQTIYLQPGNAGDALIRSGTFLLLKDLGLSLTPVSILDLEMMRKTGQSGIIFSGGGILNEYYDLGWKIIREVKESGFPVFLLPHTIDCTFEKAQSTFDHRDILFLRDRRSFNLLKESTDSTCFMTDDLAFYPPRSFWIQLAQDFGYDPKRRFTAANLKLMLEVLGRRRFIYFFLKCLLNGELSAYRTDVESREYKFSRTRGFNVDVSRIVGKASQNSWSGNLLTSARVVAFLLMFEKIRTDRLHVGICSFILDLNCELSAGSYWKNEEVYKYSMHQRKSVNFQFVSTA